MRLVQVRVAALGAFGHEQRRTRGKPRREACPVRFAREVLSTHAHHGRNPEEGARGRSTRDDVSAGTKLAEQALPPERDQRDLRGRARPGRVELVGDRTEEQARRIPDPRGRERGGRDDVGRGAANLPPSVRAIDVLEHGSGRQRDAHHDRAGGGKRVELMRSRGRIVHPDERTNVEPEAREQQRGVGDGAAESPAPRIVRGDVARRRADHDDRAALGQGDILSTDPHPPGVTVVLLRIARRR